MNAEVQLASLKPKTKGLVFDLVQALGFDVSDWVVTASAPSKIKANPKYCYEWSFIVPDKWVIFNLWHGAMRVEEGEIVYRDNFRKNAEFHRLNGGKLKWIERGDRLDRHASAAARHQLQVRVIVVDGQRRKTEDPSSESSNVTGREIDPVEWQVRSYDSVNGDFVLVRGPGQPRFIDQFDIAELGNGGPIKHEFAGSAYHRDRAVRHAALVRANGKCEYCGEFGFKMANGGIYLETHHVVPLCEEGKDNIRNVVALCPNDHKKAHFAVERAEMRRELLGRIS